MAISKYTTRVPADRSVAQTQKELAQLGARDVLMQYDDEQQISGLQFTLEVRPGYFASFALPVSWRKFQAVLEKEVDRPAYRTEAHAYRVAWRNVYEWVKAQAALIRTEMVETETVFLPYAVLPNGQTLATRVLENMKSGQPLLEAKGGNE